MVQAPLDTCNKLKAFSSFKACATPSGICDLTKFEKLFHDILLPEKTSAFELFEHLDVDRDGAIRREDFLMWLFGKPTETRELFGEALKARASELLALESQPLPEVWPTGQAPQFGKDDPMKQWWGGHVMAFCASTSLAEREALHIQRILEAGLDANAVPFPWPVTAKKQVHSLSTNAVVRQPDDTPFALPGAAPISIELTTESEKEMYEMWLSGLARSAEDLRCQMHNDCNELDTELVPWPMAEENVIKEDQCTEAQLQRIAKRAKRGLPLHPSFPVGMSSTCEEQDDCWYLRSEAKLNKTEFDTVLEMWPMLEEDPIAQDRCTEKQTCLIKRREQRSKQGLPTQAQIQQRRVDLAKALGSFGEPNVGLQLSFLREVFPTLEREAALAEMRARWAQDRAQALLDHDNLAKQGEAFTVWPSNRSWPEQPAAWTQRAAWFAMWRAKAPRLPVSLPKKEKAVKAPKLERSNSDSSLASWDALSECSWQDAADAEVGFEDILSKLSNEDLCQLKETLNQQLADANQDLQGSLSVTCNDQAVIEEVQCIKADCEKDLADAMPALEAAVHALNCLSKADIGEIKAMKCPPSGVKLAAEALCLMFSVKPRKVVAPDGQGKIDDFWDAAKKEVLGDPRLLDKMICYDKDNIPDSVIQKVMPLYNNPNFEPDIIKKASCAAMSMCMWVRALVMYHLVAKTIAPKRAALAAAEKKLVRNDDMAEAKRLSIQEIQEKQDLLEFEEAQRKGEAAVMILKELRDQKKQEQIKMDLAEAEPLLADLKKDVKKALDGLHVQDIQELKALCKPPAGVDDVVGVVAFLIKGKSLKEMNWSVAQRVMSNPGSFLLQIKAFDMDADIPMSILRRIRAIAQKEHFNVKVMKAKSSAAACLVDWALKVLQYNDLYQKVLPLRKAGEEAAANEEAEKTNALADSAAKIKAQADGELSEAMSAMEAAKEAVNCLTKPAIQELKSLGKPPVECVDVCAATAFLLKNEKKKMDWKGAQKMMKNPGAFLDEIIAFNAEEIPESALTNCEALIALPFFNYDTMKGKSSAAAYLTNWVCNIVKYNKIYKKVAPLTAKVKEATEPSSNEEVPSGNEEVPSTPKKHTTKAEVAESLSANCYLSKSDIVELKSLCKPPHGVIMVLRCVQILLGKGEDWAAGKRMLGDAIFLRTLMEYSRKDASQDQLQRVQMLLETDSALHDDAVLKVSKAAYGLLRWVRVVVSPAVVEVRMCPSELELDGELRTASPTPVTTPASTQGSTSNGNTPSTITEQSGMVHLHLSEAVAAVKAIETTKVQSMDGQNTSETDRILVGQQQYSETGKKCVIS